MVIQPAKNHRRQVMRMVERFTMLKLPVLGLIVNAAGSENDDAYYNYRDYYVDSYGYYGAEDDEEWQDERAAEEICTPMKRKSSPGAGQENEFRPLSIPKRVA